MNNAQLASARSKNLLYSAILLPDMNNANSGMKNV
jgi:hypothetical protein